MNGRYYGDGNIKALPLQIGSQRIHFRQFFDCLVGSDHERALLRRRYDPDAAAGSSCAAEAAIRYGVPQSR